MKKIFIFAVCLFSLVLTSCGGAYETRFPEEKTFPEVVTKKQTGKIGIVHRVYKADGRYQSQTAVRLRDGKIFKQTLDIYDDTPDDFYFLREGDTVVVVNKKITEIRFQK